jgi:threonine aldolase
MSKVLTAVTDAFVANQHMSNYVPPDKPKTHTDRALRLDQVQMAQEFAERVSKGRLNQIVEILAQEEEGKVTSVEALYKIQAICNRCE